MRDFGIRMEGCEDAIEAIVKEACAKFQRFIYLEIGVGGGGTLKAVTDIIRENRTDKWWSIGCDLPDGWSLNMEGVMARMPDIYVSPTEDRYILSSNTPNLILQPSSEVFSEWIIGGHCHVALIDGCHGKACVMADFLGVEPLVEKGGFVIFHDAGIGEQGVDMQPHCGEPINVRSALADLRLITTHIRTGWEYHSTILGDKARGGHSCVVVQKV